LRELEMQLSSDLLEFQNANVSEGGSGQGTPEGALCRGDLDYFSVVGHCPDHLSGSVHLSCHLVQGERNSPAVFRVSASVEFLF